MNDTLALLFFFGGACVVASYDWLAGTGDKAWFGIPRRVRTFWWLSGTTTAVLFVAASVQLYRHTDADVAQRLLPVYTLFYVGAASWAPLTVRAIHPGADLPVFLSLVATSSASVWFLVEVANEGWLPVAAGIFMLFQHLILDNCVWYYHFQARNCAVHAMITFIRVDPCRGTDREVAPVSTAWNLTAALFHFVFAVVMVALAETKGAPFVVKMERMWREPRFDAPIRGTNMTIGELIFDNPLCGGKDYVECKRRDECSIFDWFDCLKGQSTGDTTGDNWIVDSNDIEGRFYDLAPQTVAKPRVWVFLLVFELLTALFHYGAARLWENTYQKMLHMKMQPFRWLEYSLTSSIMLLCLYALSRVTDVYLLWANFGLSVFLELGGGLCFELFGFLRREYKLDQEVDAVLFYARWGFYLMSVGVFAFNIALVWDAFTTILDPYLHLVTAPLWDELFSWIRVLNISLLGLYSVFPVIHLFEFVSREIYCVDRFIVCEKLYIIASFVAKGTLVWSVFYGAMSRQDS